MGLALSLAVSHRSEMRCASLAGKSSLYLNIFPWTADAEPWRHAGREAYLEHLEAVAALLLKWERVATVKAQVQQSNAAPRRGTIPLKTVPLRLDLPNDLVRSFRP